MRATFIALCLVFLVKESVGQGQQNCQEKRIALLSIYAEPNPRIPCPANICLDNSPPWEPENEGDPCPDWCVMFNGNEKGEGAGCKLKIICKAIKNAIADRNNRPDLQGICLQNPCSAMSREWDDAEDCPRWCVRHEEKCFPKLLTVRGRFDPNAVVTEAQMHSQEMTTESQSESNEGGSNPSARFFNLGGGGGGGGGGNPVPPCLPNFPNQGGGGGILPNNFPGGVPGGFPGGFPPFFPPAFPNNCPGVNVFNTISYQQNFQPPIDIPYCDRIPCSNYDPSLENDPVACHSVPGCYYDAVLQHIRQFRHGFMLGVPVCHLVVRNSNFQRLASDYLASAPGTWQSVFTQCFIDQNRDAIYAPQPGCYTLPFFYQLGGIPKYSGWQDVNKDECILLNGCWQPTLEPYRHNCYFPSEIDQTRVRSAVDTRHNYPNYTPDGSDIFGLPMCREFRTNTPQDYLQSFYECRRAGCVLDPTINEDSIKLQLFDITTSEIVPQRIKPYFWELVNSQHIRPENWEAELAKLVGQFNAPPIPNCNFFQGGVPNLGPSYSNFNPQNLINPSLFSALAPLSLNLKQQTTARQFNFGAQHQIPITPCSQLLQGVPPHLHHHFSFLCPSQQQYACPYNTTYLPNGYLSFLPPLPGRTDTCCRKNSCYVPRGQIVRQRSGDTPFQYFYGPFTDCSKTCGGGIQKQTRQCIPSVIYNRGKKPKDDCDDEQGDRSRTCNTQPCPYWGPWKRYGSCSVTCGEGIQTRSRDCINGDLEGNNGCPVDDQGLGATQTQVCSMPPCPSYAEPGPDYPYSDCPCAPASGEKTYQSVRLPCIANCDGSDDFKEERKQCRHICGTEDCNTLVPTGPCEPRYFNGHFFGCIQQAACKCVPEQYLCAGTQQRQQSCNTFACLQQGFG